MIGKLRHWIGAETLPAAADNETAVYGAAILHLDIAGSTRLVQRSADLAHRQLRHLYARLRRHCERHHGRVRELRGDAAVVEFARAADALRAALEVQAMHALLNHSRIGKVSPDLRTGLSFGSIVSDAHLITGAAVIRAQRIEQLAPPGEVLFDQPLLDELEPDPQLLISKQGRYQLKGFAGSYCVYRVRHAQPGFLLRAPGSPAA